MLSVFEPIESFLEELQRNENLRHMFKSCFIDILLTYRSEIIDGDYSLGDLDEESIPSDIYDEDDEFKQVLSLEAQIYEKFIEHLEENLNE